MFITTLTGDEARPASFGKPIISHESIYRFAHSKEGRKESLHRYLPQGKARRGRRAKQGKKPLIPNRVSIHDRPQLIAQRQEFGHREGDLMAFSKPGHNNVVLAERKSRYILAARQPDKTAATTTASMAALFSLLPDEAKRSITFDNGGEFVGHGSLGLLTCFCDPHSPWQKGTVKTLSAGSDAICRAPPSPQTTRRPTSMT